MRRASAKRVQWRTWGRRDSARRSLADFSHAFLHHADLSQARICGFFHGAKFVDSCLVEADLSFSDFMGSPKHYETTLSGANLRGAKLCDRPVSSVSFYNADCSNADFSLDLHQCIAVSTPGQHNIRLAFRFGFLNCCMWVDCLLKGSRPSHSESALLLTSNRWGFVWPTFVARTSASQCRPPHVTPF
jgi:hypothetical protein